MNTSDAMDIQVEHIQHGGRRLRIAVVTETYPPEVNGVAHTLSRLVNELTARQHTVQLVRLRQSLDSSVAVNRTEVARTAGMQPSDADVLMPGVPIPRYPGLRMGLPCKGALVKLWSVQRPDVVHIATEGPLGWSALRAALQLKLPVSSDFRTNFHAYSRHYGMGVLLRSIMLVLRKFHNLAHLTMVPTRALRQQLESAGFKRLMVVGRGVDAGQFHPSRRSDEIRRSWGLGQDELAVICVGRLAAEKNLMLAIEAFEAIRRNRPDARLVFVGDGPLRAQLQALCPKAIFTGTLRGQHLHATVASADLFLFPSETETFGNVVIEAMASGVPVLAYRLAAAAEVIEAGVNGCTIEPSDTQAFIRTAAWMVRDTGQLKRMGLQAASDVGALEWASIAQQVEQALLQLVDDHRPHIPHLFRLPSSVAPS